MSMLHRETEELKDTRDEYRREIEKLEKRLVQCEKKEKVQEHWNGQHVIMKVKQEEELETVKEQLSLKQSVIKEKEKAIKELKNYNDHLENFKFVLNHKIKTLKDEKSPMEEQVKILENHIRNMYVELAEETSKNKNMEIKLKENKAKYLAMRDEMRKRIDQVTFAKRRLEMMLDDITNIIKTVDPKDWIKVHTSENKNSSSVFITEINNVLNKYSGPKLNGKAFGPFVKLIKQPGIQNNEDSDSDNELKISEELLRQRNWLHEKLKNMNKTNKKLDVENKKVQQDNLKLIKECNMLRDDNHKITKRVQLLEKKFKDTVVTSLSNNDMVDFQIENFLKKAAAGDIKNLTHKPLSSNTLTVKHKETPYITLKKESSKLNRTNLLSNYYKQYSTDKNMTMDQRRSGSRRRTDMEDLGTMMAKNHSALQTQNLELQVLRDQVSNFMNSEPRMMKSGSQPTLNPGSSLDNDDYQLKQKLNFPSLNNSRSTKSRQEL